MARASNAPLLISVTDGVAHLRLNRPDKRNAINDALIAAIDGFFADPPAAAKVAILAGEGAHFCAGLDLAEHKARTPIEVVHHSASWHAAFRKIQFGRLPTVALLKGAVIGGGLELALACHVRVADDSAFFQMPEGKRGIFVGGGASVRVARVIGADRMAEMMLTGRKLDAAEGVRLGLAHYLVKAEAGDSRVRELAREIKGNAPVTNFLILNALARIADMPAESGLFTESLAAAIAQTAPEAKKGLEAFLSRKKPRR
jgi:enoyl-CoA hydratase/carnithine racemase